MTTTPPVGEPEPQWQQPAFQTERTSPEPSSPQPVHPSSVIAPRAVPVPPSVTETVTATISGLVWPVMILLAIMGTIGWWPAIMISLVASVVLGNVSTHLKARRKALSRGVLIEEDDEGQLR